MNYGLIMVIGTNEKPQTERMIKEYKQSKLNFGILQEGKLKDIINQCGLVYEIQMGPKGGG